MRFIAILLLGLAIVPAAPAQDVLTQHNDAVVNDQDDIGTAVLDSGIASRSGRDL